MVPITLRRRALESLLAGVGLSLACGCASLRDAPAAPPAKAPPWRLEPVFDVSTPVRASSAGRGYYTLGRYYEGSKEWGPAERAYRRALAIDADYPDALDALGVLLGRTGRAGEAEPLLRRAVALAPARASLHNNLGYLLLAGGRTAEAARELEAGVAADPGDAVARANLRVAQARLEDAMALAAARSADPVGRAIAPTPAPSTQAAPVPASDPARTVAFMPAPALPIASPPASVVAQTPAAPWAAATLATPRAPVRRLEISNGNGVAGMAAQVGRLLASQGLPSAALSNAASFTRPETLIQYRPGDAEAALRVANSLPAPARLEATLAPQAGTDVRVLLGRDWIAHAPCLQRDDCRPVVVVAAAAKATLR
ncbi:MAG: LytR C-terminal domain-containing protein [Burkholderiales bacterium]|nr:LytR C-terminal domain-containing protein [Burkholderiales bacterium]